MHGQSSRLPPELLIRGLQVRLLPGRLVFQAPASLVVLSELKVVALAVHPHGDVPGAGPRVQRRAEGMEGTGTRGHGTAREAAGRSSRTELLAVWGLQRKRARTLKSREPGTHPHAGHLQRAQPSILRGGHGTTRSE